jgi:uncharacterized membrane protein
MRTCTFCTVGYALLVAGFVGLGISKPSLISMVDAIAVVVISIVMYRHEAATHPSSFFSQQGEKS